MNALPCLFISWRRTDAIINNLPILRDCGIRDVYIFSDGISLNSVVKREVQLARSYLTALPSAYPDLLFYFNFAKHNLGCRYGVEAAIDWFFSRVDTGIIIEDDICLTKAAIQYLQTYSDLLASNRMLFSVGAYTPYPIEQCSQLPADGFKTPIFYCWGWMSTRYSWLRYRGDQSFSLVNYLRYSSLPYSICFYMLESLLLTKIREKDTWDILVQDYIIRNQLYCIHPRSNYVKNIGYDDIKAAHGVQAVDPTPNVFPLAISNSTQHPDFADAPIKQLSSTLYYGHGIIRLFIVVLRSLFNSCLRRFVANV